MAAQHIPFILGSFSLKAKIFRCEKPQKSNPYYNKSKKILTPQFYGKFGSFIFLV